MYTLVLQIVIICDTFMYYFVYRRLRRNRNERTSSLVSLRITDEELALLDARIGIEGARNRSDVIRMAIRDYLHEQPLLQDLDQVKVTIGRK